MGWVHQPALSDVDPIRTALLSAQGIPGTWQERECLHVTGPDDREVPAVKRGDPGQPGALGDGRHGGTGDAGRKIKISLHEFGHAADVSALELGDLEPVTIGRPEKVTSACGPARDCRRYPISPRTGEGTSSGPSACRRRRRHAWRA